MRHGQECLTQAGSGQFFVTWVGSATSGFGKFPFENTKCFKIFSPSVLNLYLRVGSKSTWVKDTFAFYLLQAKSMLGSSQGPSLP